jgi:hypothetical protein
VVGTIRRPQFDHRRRRAAVLPSTPRTAGRRRWIGTLLRTIDGSKWAAAGSVDPLSSVVFISPERGFFLRRAQGIQTTMDGGRTWRLGYLCESGGDRVSRPMAPPATPSRAGPDTGRRRYSRLRMPVNDGRRRPSSRTSTRAT